MRKLTHLSVMFATIVALGLGQTYFAKPSHADTFPSLQPVRIVVPFGAGGQSDITARMIAERMQAVLGQTVMVENRGGGGTMIGAGYVARAEPDGYTILYAGGSSVVTPHLLYSEVAYGPDDLIPISGGVEFPWVITVRNDLPVETVEDFISHARSQADGLSYANTGRGSLNHLIGQLFIRRFDIPLIDVPYPGMAQAAIDLTAGRVDMAIEGLMSAKANHDAGNYRILATTGAERSPVAPDIPTLVESGYPDLIITTWQGFVAPAGTPEPIIIQLNEALRVALTDPEVVEVLTTQAQTAAPSSPEEFATKIEDERALWAPIIEDLGIRLD